MEAREFTWKLTINPKADFASSHMWQGESGDAVAYEDAYKSYQVRSSLRPYLLVKTSIRYLKTEKKYHFAFMHHVGGYELASKQLLIQ